MARPLTLLLVRHGQSEWNAAGLMQGQTPHVPLDRARPCPGRGGRRRTGRPRPARCISSDLVRAVQTAEHCARATGLAIDHHPGPARAGYGVLEGRPSRELWDVVDWTDRALVGRGRREPGRAARPGRGLPARTSAPSPPADVIALVTHGDTIRAAQAVVAGLGPDAMPAVTPHNGTVTRLELIP